MTNENDPKSPRLLQGGQWIGSAAAGLTIEGVFKAAERLLLIGVVQYAAYSLDSEALWVLSFALFLAYFAWLWRSAHSVLQVVERRSIAGGRVATALWILAVIGIGVAAGWLLDDVVNDLVRLNRMGTAE